MSRDEFGVMIRTGLKDLQNELHDQTRRTADLNENVQRLAQLGENIGSITSALEKEHSKFLSDMQRLYDQASMERVFRNLETAVVAMAVPAFASTVRMVNCLEVGSAMIIDR
jgi:hypothetical protein